MKKLHERIRQLIEKFKLNKLRDTLKSRIDKGSNKYSWSDFVELLASMATLATYFTISYAVAEYEKKVWLYIFYAVALAGMIYLTACKFICLFPWNICKKICLWVVKKVKAIVTRLREVYIRIRFAIPAVIALAGLLIYNYHNTEYYREVVEIYGVPVGTGEPMTLEERKNCAGYWKIENYPIKKQIKLEYQEPYGQMEIMRDKSTLYGMRMFQPTPHIVCRYRKGKKDKYRGYGQEHFITAKNCNFREAVKTSYYFDDNKLLLELERIGDGDSFQIISYSLENIPQLLNSTLLIAPEDEDSQRAILSQQVEVTYNEDGLPETRKLNQYSCNLYGINGERYVYDQNKRLAALYYLDSDGEPVCNMKGIMMIAFRYDEKDMLQSISYFSDEKGSKPTEGFNGVFCEKFQYNSQ